MRRGESPATGETPPDTRAGIGAKFTTAAVGLALLAAIAVGVLAVATLALERPTWNYDALSRWMFKARAFLADRSVLPYFDDLERGVTQPHYPPLVPL